MRSRKAHAECVNRVPISATCCASVHAVKTPGKSPRGRSPRSRRKAPAKPPQHVVQKRLLLEPSACTVCTCSELLRRLETTIHEPPPPPSFSLPQVDSFIANSLGRSTSFSAVQRSLKKEPPLIVESTASFDEAIVIDSDDSDDDGGQFSETSETRQPQNDSFQHGEEGESPKKSVDSTAEPLNVAIKVSLPLPKKLSTADCPSRRQHRQRSNSNTSHRSKLTLISKGRKKVIDTDQEISTCNGQEVPSSRVSGDAAETEQDASVETAVLNCSTDCTEGEQRTISTEANADGIAQPVDHEQHSLHDVCDSVEPDVSLPMRSCDEVTVDVERQEILTANNQSPDQFVKSVPRVLLKTGAAADQLDEGGEDTQRSATATENAGDVEKKECGLTEKLLTDIDTSAFDESHVSVTGGANVEICAQKSCTLPSVLDNIQSTLHTTNAKANSPEHAEDRLALSTASNDTDPSTVHNEKPQSACVRLRLPLKNRSGKASSSYQAVKKMVRKIKQARLSRQIYKRSVTALTSKKFRKSPKYRKRRALSERLQPQTERCTLLSRVDDESSTNNVIEGKSLISTEDDVIVQKYTNTEHVVSSVEQDTAADAVSDPVDQQAATPRPEVGSLTERLSEIDEPRCGSSVAADQQESSQVVTAQPTASPVHTEDGEVAHFSMTSTERVSSSPCPDWVKARPHNNEQLTYSDIALRNRLQGIFDVNDNV